VLLVGGVAVCCLFTFAAHRAVIFTIVQLSCLLYAIACHHADLFGQTSISKTSPVHVRITGSQQLLWYILDE